MTEEIAVSRATHLEPLSLAWRFFAAPQTLLALIGLVAVTLLLGTVIPQIPPQGVDDPQAWLAVQPGIWGVRSELVYALGLYGIYGSFWFRLLLALVGLTLFVCLVESAGLAWRATVQRDWPAAAFASWGGHALQIQVSTPRSVDEALVRVRDYLTQRGYRWVDATGLPALNAVAGRHLQVLWAEPAVYGALMVVLIGLAIDSNWGWQGTDWRPAPGETWSVEQDTSLAVRLEAFELELDEAGRLRDYHSEITWLDGDAEVGRESISVGKPSATRGVAVRQVGYVPVVKMRGRTAAGRPLAFQVGAEESGTSGQVEIAFPTPDSQQLLLVLGQDLFLALTFEPLCAEGKPALYVAVLDDGGSEQRPVATLHDSATIDVDGLQVEVDLGYLPILRANHRPGMGLVVAGMALAVFALAVAWLVAPRLLWIVAGPGDGVSTLVLLLALPGAKGSRWPSQLAGRLRGVLAHDA